jgi:glycosyltransferase involved in cell wall biosynthesis
LTATKNILLITSGQPSLNPRLVKEADALSEAGYKVTVIYQYWNNWGTEMDVELLSQKKWTAIKVGGDPHNQKFKFWKSRILQKTAKVYTKIFGLGNLAEILLNRSVFELYSVAVKIPASIYIAHNLGALPAAIWAAKKNSSKCGFDAEDFHRFEVSDDLNSLDVRLKKYIEDKYIPQLTYLSTASPLISEAYKQLYPNQNPKTILNVFPKQKILKVDANNKGSLRLFWFSQTVGKNRGLEDVIAAMGKVKSSKIELHLLGNYNTNIQDHFAEVAVKSGIDKKAIFYYPPIPAEEIFKFASQFDIGLATEIREPKNRDICLTNKIFTYIQSGLGIVASNTSAQQELMLQYPEMGFTYDPLKLETLTNALNIYCTDKNILGLHQKKAARYAFENLNWEQEKNIFLGILKDLL